jgi:hypothetical protein
LAAGATSLAARWLWGSPIYRVTQDGRTRTAITGRCSVLESTSHITVQMAMDVSFYMIKAFFNGRADEILETNLWR